MPVVLVIWYVVTKSYGNWFRCIAGLVRWFLDDTRLSYDVGYQGNRQTWKVERYMASNYAIKSCSVYRNRKCSYSGQKLRWRVLKISSYGCNASVWSSGRWLTSVIDSLCESSVVAPRCRLRYLPVDQLVWTTWYDAAYVVGSLSLGRMCCNSVRGRWSHLP